MGNFFKKMFGFLKVGAVPVEVLVTALNPPLGAVFTAVLNGVIAAEARHGAGAGGTKAQEVLSSLATFGPMIVSVVEKATGHQIADDALLAESMGDLNNAIVKFLNAVGVLPKPAAVTTN